MVKETINKEEVIEEKKRGRKKKSQKQLRVESTETFTSTEKNHVGTELTYRDTTNTWGANDLFGLLGACSN